MAQAGDARVSEGSPRIIPPDLPILMGFAHEILPVLIVLWGALAVAWALTGQVYTVPIAIWATVTTLMLWPVGHRLGRRYLTYRTGLFVLGVLSMAYIPFIGFVLQSQLPYGAKVVLWLLLPLDLTIFGILPSLRQGIGQPIRMFFRPDLLFGDGRVLCCGIIVTVLGLRYMLGPHPPAGVPIAIPKWDWWGIAYAMAAGFVPIIPLRGMNKLLARMNRLITGRWGGWDGILFKEGLLIIAALSIGWGFHHVFKGAAPFTAASWHEIHEALEAGHHPLGWLLLTLGALWLVVVRGGYKRAIGEPFIKETRRQTWIKEVLFVVGFLPLFLGFMLLIEGDFGGWNPWPQWLVGLLFFLWGLAVLLPFRVLAQVNQRRAIVQQMAAVVLPAHRSEVRRRVLLQILPGLATLPEEECVAYMRAMQQALDETPEETRQVMAEDRLWCMAQLPSDVRRTLMRRMDLALART